MFARLRDWLREARRWHREHIEAWHGATTPGVDGFSAFQRECEAALLSKLANSGLTLSDREVRTEMVDTERTEQVIYGQIAPSGIIVCIASDVALMYGPGIDERFEEWDALTPSELIDSFCTAVVARATDRAAKLEPAV